jgi:hypothetical protein
MAELAQQGTKDQIQTPPNIYQTSATFHFKIKGPTGKI